MGIERTWGGLEGGFWGGGGIVEGREEGRGDVRCVFLVVLC